MQPIKGIFADIPGAFSFVDIYPVTNIPCLNQPNALIGLIFTFYPITVRE